jgi:ribose 5-phosphate isomerase A
MNAKKAAAEKAVEYIKDGMVIGLGTGSTAYWAIMRIGELIKDGLKISAITSSAASEALAIECNIPLAPIGSFDKLDIAIDGADEVDEQLNLIKGGGGALLREKIIASNSRQFFVIIDESKLKTRLGEFPLPVEIMPFGSWLTVKHIQDLGCKPVIRRKDGKDFITDNNNRITDCSFSRIDDAVALNMQLHEIPGVVETGLFAKQMVSRLFVGRGDGTVRVMQP